jgi:hypothetical protein
VGDRDRRSHDHPHTITIFDYGLTPEGVFYYAMELLDGASLEKVVAVAGRLPPARAVHVLYEVAGALVEAHEAGLVHRDVKPANIILCRQGGLYDFPKVVDFGLVKDLEPAGDAALTHADVIAGTPLYIAPEAITSPQSVSPQSDLYSLGAVGYFALTGQSVFPGRTLVEVCSHHLHTRPEPPSTRLGEPLPADLEALVLDCLEKDPARRPGGARELRRRLEACADFGGWTEDDARAWWEANAGAAAPAAPGPVDGALTLTRRLSAGLLAVSLLAPAARAEDPARFWDRQRRGANCQNRRVDAGYWNAAAAAGLDFVRLLPDAWPSRSRDFLMASADGFTALDEADLATLRRALDEAGAAGVRVVLAPLSLPGARWKQLNGDVDDARLWRDAAFQAQAEDFWRRLAGRLRGHAALAAYNPLNEPHPERAFGFEDPDEPGFAAWLRKARGSPADLDAFNRRIVAAIREADPETPILLDGWFYASPEGLALLEPVPAPGVLYAFHFYDPWEYTTFRVNGGRWAYPDRLPGPGGTAARWGADTLRSRVAPVARWAREHGVPPLRIVAAEYGVDRRVAGALAYLTDLVAVLDGAGWHSAFYAFRGDGEWTGLDYELGFDRVDPRIWGAIDRGEDPEVYKRRHRNPLWRVLARPSPAAP